MLSYAIAKVQEGHFGVKTTMASLKSINFIDTSFLFPLKELQIAVRLIDFVYSKNYKSQLFAIIDGSQILKYGHRYYALENYLLINCLSKLSPELEFNFKFETVSSKRSLYEKIIERVFLDSIFRYEIKSLLAIEQKLNDEFGLNKMFSKSELARILGVHRSTLYKLENKLETEDELKVDLDAVLSSIPKKGTFN